MVFCHNQPPTPPIARFENLHRQTGVNRVWEMGRKIVITLVLLRLAPKHTARHKRNDTLVVTQSVAQLGRDGK